MYTWHLVYHNNDTGYRRCLCVGNSFQQLQLRVWSVKYIFVPQHKKRKEKRIIYEATKFDKRLGVGV